MFHGKIAHNARPVQSLIEASLQAWIEDICEQPPKIAFFALAAITAVSLHAEELSEFPESLHESINAIRYVMESPLARLRLNSSRYPNLTDADVNTCICELLQKAEKRFWENDPSNEEIFKNVSREIHAKQRAKLFDSANLDTEDNPFNFQLSFS